MLCYGIIIRAWVDQVGGSEVQFSNLQSGHLQKSIEAQGKGMAASLVCKSRRRLQTWAKRFTTKFDVLISFVLFVLHRHVKS